ncbi:MAG TPA: biotin--[acetyl-CoA-carboxylase] ligase [Candidatus Dormibacteraeota bacterium]|nr:biotin--[acetyl-CoA-carboxylase] ligase [Candidatus Dormibacteraeota bacterium]
MHPTAGTDAPFFSRQERFDEVGSTNDVVRGWLAAGAPEVCLAVADVQAAGRGRSGRAWVAPAGAALLLSLGFRPAWLPPDRAWRLPATVSLAMADAAEEVAALPDGTIRLKWPNDLVVETAGPEASLVGELDASAAAERLSASVELRKLGGVLAESDGLGTRDPRLVVGIGINADWPASSFPPELASTMTSLRVACGGRPVDRAMILDAFTSRLEPRVEALRDGRFDIAGWLERSATTGRDVELLHPDGRLERARSVGLDSVTGALVLHDPAGPGGERQVLSGEVVRLRLATGASQPARSPGAGV